MTLNSCRGKLGVFIFTAKKMFLQKPGIGFPGVLSGVMPRGNTTLNLTSYLANKCFEYLLKCDTNQENINSRPAIQQKSPNHTPSDIVFPLPWSIAPKHFRELCNGCGICLTACENNIITKDKAGYPLLDFSRGSCSFCGACARKCPQDALQYDSIKPPWHLKAVITPACLMNNRVLCSTCFERCEQNAIIVPKAIHPNKTLRVISEKCNGCGACIGACPVDAIIVKNLSPTILTQEVIK